MVVVFVVVVVVVVVVVAFCCRRLLSLSSFVAFRVVYLLTHCAGLGTHCSRVSTVVS